MNNAGIAVTAPLEVIPIDEFRHQLEVNVVGQAAVTQALLPALRRGKGTVVMISSIGGRLALPIAGPYAASKFALEGLSDSLRREVRHLGVKVVVVEPGGIKTPIWDKGLEGIDEQKAGVRGRGDEAVRRAGRSRRERIPQDLDRIRAAAVGGGRGRRRRRLRRSDPARGIS